MDRLRKIFTISIMMVTVLAMSVVVAPSVDAAATGGDLVKMDGLASIYYLGSDGNRYVFPNEATYFSWYNDFSGVVTIPQEELEGYPLKANVTIRPGTKLITSPSNAKVYAVGVDGVLQQIPSEESAIALYGETWATMVVDIVDSFFTNYEVGAELGENEYASGQLFKTADASDVYYYDGTNSRKITSEAAFTANRFSWDYIMTVPEDYTMTMGDDVVGNEDLLSDTSQGGGGQGDVAGTGLTVALASDTAASATIPQGASVKFVKFNLTASNDGDVNVTSLKLTAGGLGIATVIDDVALYNAGKRIGNIKSIDSNNEATFNLGTPLAIDAGSTESVTVKAKVTTGTNQHNLGIKSASDIMTNGATVSGSFPVVGNTMSVADVTVGELTIDDDGSPSSPDLGDMQATIAKFKLANNNVEDITFNSIVLKKSAGDAADDDFENMKLVSGGSVVATSAGLSGKYVTFELDTPMLIEKGKTKKFQVKADIIDGASKTVTISLSNHVDVDAVGEYYGQSSLIDGTFTGTSLTIAAGAVSLAKENAANSKTRADETNVEFGTIKLTVNSGDNTVEMTTLKLTIDSVNDTTVSGAFHHISNIEILDKGANTVYELTASTTAGDADTAIYLNTDLGLYFSAGETKELVVRADVASSASTSQKYTVKINNAANDIYLKETVDDTEITDITPNSITLKQKTVQNPAVTFTKNTLASETVVVGSEDVLAASINVEANSVDDLKLTELKFADRDTGDTMTSAIISSLNLYKGETLVKSKSGSSLTTEEITFNDLTETVSAGKSNTYMLKLTFVNDDTYSETSTRWYVSGYSIEDVAEGTARYDATADDGAGSGTASDGVIHTDEAGYTSLSSANTITLSGAGNLRVQMNNTNSETNQDTYVLANTQSDLLAAIKLRAENEEVNVTDLSVYASTTNSAGFQNMVSKLYLVDSDKVTILAEETVVSATTTFDNFTEDFMIGDTSRTIYIKADVNKIGKSAIGEVNTFAELKVTEIAAEGGSSGTALADAAESGGVCASGKICWDDDGDGAYTSTDYITEKAKIFGVLAAMISNVDLVSSAEGTEIDTSINGTGWINAAIMKVTVDSTTNTLSTGEAVELILNKVKVQVEKNDDTLLASNGVSIERLGSGVSGYSTSTLDDVTASGTVYATMDMSESDLSTDDNIEPGTTVYYLIKAYVGTLDGGTGNDWIRVNLDLFNGTSCTSTASGANLMWQDGSDATAKYPLRLSTTKKTGTKIVEPS